MESKSKLNAFKADPINQLAKDKPVQFFIITASIFYTVFFVILDLFIAATESTLEPHIVRVEVTVKIMLMALSTTAGIRLRWKIIERKAKNKRMDVNEE